MNQFVQTICPANVEFMVKAMKACNKAAVAERKTVVFKAIGSSIDGVIIGIGAAAGSPRKLDLDEEFVDKADLTAMAYDFCAAKNRTFKANHKEDIEVDLVASWPGTPIIKNGNGVRMLREDEQLTNDMEVVGIGTAKGGESHWFVGARPRDPQIAALAAKGGIAGFSFGALVSSTEI